MKGCGSAWSMSPETIMSHHYTLARGVRHAIDNNPPFSMYNSPISVHYVPKRASSADPQRRRPLSKSQRELTEFVNKNSPLRLPLPLRSSYTDLVQSKLINNRNYQPPRSRNIVRKPVQISDSRQKDGITMFKDQVLTEAISRKSYDDKELIGIVRAKMDQFTGIIPWKIMESAGKELLKELDVKSRVDLRIESHFRNQRNMSKSMSNTDFYDEGIASPESSSSTTSSSSASSSDSSTSSTSSSESSSSSAVSSSRSDRKRSKSRKR